MRRFSMAIAAASVLALAALPATASATEIQVGATATAVAAPTCPAGTTSVTCYILLTEETALQTVSNGQTSPDVITQSGDLSAFTVGISSAAKPYDAALSAPTADKGYNGPPEVEVTVLRPMSNGLSKRYEVAAEGPLENLTAYQGDVVQFPLPQELPVTRGEVIALTTPTWAPVLSFDLSPSASFSYLQSRVGNCDGKSSTTYFNPQTALGDVTTFGCAFTGTRAEYTATEITTPTIVAAIRRARIRHTGAALTPRIIKRG